MLRKRDWIISKVKARYSKRTHKFGIMMPKTFDEAYQLHEENGNNIWTDAINKKLKNAQPAFKVLYDGEKVPVGYPHIKCHFIFDVKMCFTRKTSMVARDHMTDPPAYLTYSSVVSRYYV